MANLELDYSPSKKTIEIFDSIKNKMGMIPNIYKLMGCSPHVLEGFISFTNSLSNGNLSPQDREHIALAVAGFNKCQYCASAHALLAKKVGISSDEIKQNLKGQSELERARNIISFSLIILNNKGFVDENEFIIMKNKNFSNEQIVEIIANVCANIFTNYFNHIAGTKIDFPVVELN